MSVVGSLEDLSFPDILQMIHASRQSGVLVLTSPDAERRVRFRDGLVCGATLGSGGTELEDMLIERGHLDRAALPAARQRREATGETLAAALVAIGAVPQALLEQVVRDELRSILRALVLLQEGEFRFVAEEDAAPPGEGLGLNEGLSPDSILPPEEVRRTERQAADRRRVPRGTPDRRAARPAVPRHVLLIIDRAVLRYALKDELRRRRFQVEACAAPASGLELARSLARRGIAFNLVCDLILPDPTGKGWQGGLDLLREIRKLSPDAPAVMVGDVRGAGAEAESRAAGALGYLPFPDLGACALSEVGDRLVQFATQVRAAIVDPERLSRGAEESHEQPLRVIDQLSLLRGLVGELHTEESVEIPLLVLRLAAEFFERGVFFAVRGGEAHGSGAFASDESGAASALEDRMRGVVLPLARGSLLYRAVHSRMPYVGPIPRSRLNAALVERLGTYLPEEAALLPVLGGRQVLAVLYGDNGRTGRGIGDLRGLEIFVAQAGTALHNALLQRRVEALRVRGGSEGFDVRT